MQKKKNKHKNGMCTNIYFGFFIHIKQLLYPLCIGVYSVCQKVLPNKELKYTK